MTTWAANMTSYIRAMARSASSHKPNLDGLDFAADHLSASAHSIEAADLASACERLVLACGAMYGSLADLKQLEEFHREVDEALDEATAPVSVYIDTNIVSEGIAKHRLEQNEQQALDRILEKAQLRFIDLQTSEVMKRELEALPPAHQVAQLGLYRLIKLVSANVVEHDADPTGAILHKLKSSLSANDYAHVAEAVHGSLDVFLTMDGGILANAELVSKTGMRVMRPVELENYLRAQHLIP